MSVYSARHFIQVAAVIARSRRVGGDVGTLDALTLDFVVTFLADNRRFDPIRFVVAANNGVASESVVRQARAAQVRQRG